MSLFEVKRRDGLARLSIFEKNGEVVQLPAAIEVTDLFPSLAKEAHSNIPLSAPAPFVKRYEVAYDEVVPVHPASETVGTSGDCLVVPNWHTALTNPRDYVGWLISLKQRQVPDAMWYAPAAALPSNVALLVYSGFDLFDFTGVDLKTVQGQFCSRDGEFPAHEWLGNGSCSCPGCENGDLKAHNRYALIQEIAVLRHFIAAGHMRELIDGRCRVNAAQVSILRLLDEAYEFAEPSAPVARSSGMNANSGESIRRAEVRRFAERVIDRFIPLRSDVCVLLPCSAKKPYSYSQSHRLFQGAIRNRAHELIVTSPLGLVPRELEGIYPAAHYDVPVTGYWDREESAFITDVLVRYFKKHSYGRVIGHLDGGAFSIAKEAADICGIEIERTCQGRPTSRASLASLDEALTGEHKKQTVPIRGCLSWQFGVDVDTMRMMLKGRESNRRVMRGKTQLFSIDPANGFYRPTFEGWETIPKGYRVMIDDFIPQGDILAPGILDIDPRIREGDEVLVVGPNALATGRAMMGADESMASSRGVAVKVRKVKKLSH
jgi:archaeosine synthase